MSRVKEYEANAVEIEKQADQAEDLEIKRLLRATAANWRKLAGHVRRREH